MMDQCPVQGQSKTLFCLTQQKPTGDTVSKGHLGQLACKGFDFSLTQLCTLKQLLVGISMCFLVFLQVIK